MSRDLSTNNQIRRKVFKSIDIPKPVSLSQTQQKKEESQEEEPLEQKLLYKKNGRKAHLSLTNG